MNDEDGQAPDQPREAYRAGERIRHLAELGYGEYEIGRLMRCAPEAVRAALAQKREAA